MKLLKRLPRESGGDYALRTIKENIISLELPPGSQISENELAAEMGLSLHHRRSRASVVQNGLSCIPCCDSSVRCLGYDAVRSNRR